jgi:hypothetical protein
MGRFIDILKTEIPIPDRVRKIEANARRRTVKLLKWSAKAAFVLAVVLLVVGGIASIIGGRQYEAELQKLKDKGEPYTLVGLAGPMPPDSENGAVIYQKVFKRLWPIDRPNGLREDAGKAYDKLTGNDVRPTSKDWDEASRVVAKLDWLPAMIKEATARPECKFPVRWQDGFSAMLPQLAEMRQISRMITLKGIVDAHHGNAESAVQSTQLAIQSSRALETEPCLISFLVHIAQLNNMTKALRIVANEASLNASQAKAIYVSLSDIDLRPHWILSFKGERGYGLLTFAQIRRGKLQVPELLEMDSDGGAVISDSWLFAAAGWVWRPLSYFDSAAYLRFMQKQVDLAGVHYRDLKPGLSKELLEAVPKYAILTRVLCPVYDGVAKSADRADSELALGQAAMTLIAYKDKFGSYPASLAEASSKVGWKIPEDPFAGTSLRYTRQGKGFKVYSIGANLKDDGGSPPPKGKNWDEAGDIVWSMDH